MQKVKVRIKYATLGKWKECKNKELVSGIFNKKNPTKPTVKTDI